MPSNSSHTITALVQDQPGVLNRVTSMIRRRNFNISSLSVGHSEIEGLSRMTFVVEGDELILEQIAKQLGKLINVVNVTHIDNINCVSREFALIRVQTTPDTRQEIIQIATIFRADVIDVARNSMIVETTGDSGKLDSLVLLLQPFGIVEVIRSGVLAMKRGPLESDESESTEIRQPISRIKGKAELGW